MSTFFFSTIFSCISPPYPAPPDTTLCVASGGKMVVAAPDIIDAFQAGMGRGGRGTTDICPFYKKVIAFPESSL